MYMYLHYRKDGLKLAIKNTKAQYFKTLQFSLIKTQIVMQIRRRWLSRIQQEQLNLIQ